MRITWKQTSSTEWIGSAPWLELPVAITYVPDFDMYVTDGTESSYKTLTAAKIAVARATH